jgi:hypothetical protein
MKTEGGQIIGTQMFAIVKKTFDQATKLVKNGEL